MRLWGYGCGHCQAAGDEEAQEAADLVVDARKLADSSLGFWHGFVASISGPLFLCSSFSLPPPLPLPVIIVSELGDKTWFIAAILAMRHPRLTVFAGAMGALALMTALSGSPSPSLRCPSPQDGLGSLSGAGVGDSDHPAGRHLLRFHCPIRHIWLQNAQGPHSPALVPNYVRPMWNT